VVNDHDPLCAWPITIPGDVHCFGCWLVELRSDAAYSDPDDRETAIATLRQVIDLAQAHLHDALEHGP
jgi:hypothetical protein